MTRNYPHGQGAVKLVSTDWLGEQIGCGTVTILDAQPNIHDYIQEHIPGAFYLNEGLFRYYFGHLPSIWVDPPIVEHIFQCCGLNADTPVVVYTGKGSFKGWGDGLEQTMVAYTLARYGHQNVYVLDGGIDKWKKEGRLVDKKFPPEPFSNFKTNVQKDFYIAYEEFKTIKDREDVMLLDARPINFYEGQGPWIKPGHIPGAINLPGQA